MSYVVRVREPVDTLVGENGTPKLDPSDPRVRKIVYSMYRDMLSNRNNEANIFISQKDPACVTQDLGVVPILESIIRQGTTSTGGSSGGSIPIPQAPPLPPTNGTLGIPPPPPMGPSGLLPAVRLSTEIGPLNKGPPLAIQGSMLKEKKPFTYTPGGIDLSEIRSPRMAKRIQMNAAAEGVTSVPVTQTHSGQGISAHHPYLPPAALAAMQPQLPVAVFPQGALNTQSLHRPSKSIDYAPPQPSNHQRQSSLPSQLTHQIQNNNVVIPSPPPPPPPTLVQEVRQVMSPQMSGSKLSSSGGQPMSLASVMMNQSIRSVQQAPRESQVHPHVMDSCRQDQQTKVQAVSQQIGSNYIPPVLGPVVGERSQTPQMNTSPSVKKNPLSLGSIDSDSDRDINRTSSVSTTPQLNKAPTPWLNAHNRMTQQQSPSYVVIPSPSSQNCTPWGPSLTTGRTIPVSIVRDEELSWDEIEGKSNNLQKFQSQPASSSINGRAFPIQMSCGSPTDHSAQSTSISGGSSTPLHTVTRMIPIQIQGQVTQISVTPQRQQQPNYNSPTGLFSSHRVGEHTGTQKPGNTGLNEGMSKISISQDEPYKTDPIQSKSFKVIQRITDDAEENIEEQKHKLELKGEDKELMETIKAKVDDSSLHQTTEPRFRGGHIPSRAFQALRSHLPPNPITCDELPVISTKSGPVTHNIQIRMAPESPTPTFQQHQYQTPLIDSTGQVRSISITPSSHQNQRYTAGNAPSRSFKLIQVSHPSDNPHGSGTSDM